VGLDARAQRRLEPAGDQRVELARVWTGRLHRSTIIRLMAVDLGTHFLARLPPGRRTAFEAREDLDAHLRDLLARARAAHPDVALDDAGFVDAVAERVEDDLDAIHAADLYLAMACARGEPAAIGAFDRAYGGELDLAIARSPRLGVSRDEFHQLVRTRLFVGDAGRPARITTYSGHGQLRAWVRVTAARVVIDLSRGKDGRASHADDALLDRVASPDDPELRLLRATSGAHLQAAFRDGLARLSVRQRNLLRQRYLHGLSADQLAPIYAVHRTTAFGWLDDARRALLAHVREALRARMPDSELDSVIAALGSQLELSVRQVLGDAIEDET
jgi:RNA polymerase sigma-70 factor (ECF subfamily)